MDLFEVVRHVSLRPVLTMNYLIKILNPVVTKPIPSAAETAAHEVWEPSFLWLWCFSPANQKPLQIFHLNHLHNSNLFRTIGMRWGERGWNCKQGYSCGSDRKWLRGCKKKKKNRVKMLIKKRKEAKRSENKHFSRLTHVRPEWNKSNWNGKIKKTTSDVTHSSEWTQWVQPWYGKLSRSEYLDDMIESAVEKRGWAVLNSQPSRPISAAKEVHSDFSQLHAGAAAAVVPPRRRWFMALVMVQPAPPGIGLLCPDLIK